MHELHDPLCLDGFLLSKPVAHALSHCTPATARIYKADR
ncbi:hypothetical protein Thimo_2298 [Thioflavicoccus mobilis 8321]|uniref:Uncharacterized protein n=1 Tax=Thioflavicoccus mobilis 8321 TaxID=765912 RepID=L0GYL8_9GAMM|nr:hypothetical protein Thimo_2298 [Thioflavicoccus mobilis 8321]